MPVDWTPVTQELRLYRADGVDLPLWWRDDDAVTRTPALEHLAAISESLSLPVHIAAIPSGVDTDLASYCKERDFLLPVVHGQSHVNHAPDGQKKAEFGHLRAGLVEDAEAGLAQASAVFGEDLAAVFVPPWNRIAPELVNELSGLGYKALSTFTPRKQRFAAPGLEQINTHIDPINWRGGGGLNDVDQQVLQVAQLLKDRRTGRADATEPLGLLTHHLVHDAGIWAFSEALLKTFLDAGARPVTLAETLAQPG